MAMKVHANDETKKEASENSVSILNQFSPATLFNIPQPSGEKDLLPRIKIPYPIEMDQGFQAGDVYHVGLYDGNDFTHLKAGSIITVIAAREGSRKLVAGKEGKPVYERAYKAMGSNNASDAVYQAHLTDPKADKGVCYVVAIIDPSGKSSCLAAVDAFKTMKDYWGRPLYQALASNKLGLKLTSNDHTANTTVSKSSGKAYLDPKKFKQNELVELNDDLIAVALESLNTSKDKFVAWIKQ